MVFAKLTGERERIIETHSATCLTTNEENTHLFVGSSNGSIYEYRVNLMKEYREIFVSKDEGL